MNAIRPIFVIDTCIGGLSVVKSLHAAGRVSNIVFVADYAVNPLGVKSAKEIADVVQRWLTMAAQHSDTAVIACNTLSVHYQRFSETRECSTGPGQVVSMVDCFKRMVNRESERLAGRKVLVIGTAFTASQPVYSDILHDALPGLQVATVTATDLERSIARFEPVDSAARPLSDAGLHEAIENTDVAILACTCFPLIRAELESRFPHVLFLDPGNHCDELLPQSASQADLKLQIRVTGDVVAPSQVTQFAEAYLCNRSVES
jgi:glutamate racemase